MRVNIFSCLLALVLGCNITAGIFRHATDRTSTTLTCRHDVRGSVFTRTRGSDGPRDNGYLAVIRGKTRTTPARNAPPRLPNTDRTTKKKKRNNTAREKNKGKNGSNVTLPPTATTTGANETTSAANTGILHEIAEEKTSATLHCPLSVEGDVTWSRESNGNKVDILTAGESDTRHNDPEKRFSSLVDKSLFIRRVTISDSGRYLCNNEPAVELTVIPSGTIRRHATDWTSITLTCPHDVGGSVITWSRGSGDIQQEKRFYVSPVDNTLWISAVQHRDSGLYYCNGKPAVYLTVIRGSNKTLPPTATTTGANETTSAANTGSNETLPPTATTGANETTSAAATPYLWQMCVRTVIVILYLIIMISITAATRRKARQIAATETEK